MQADTQKHELKILDRSLLMHTEGGFSLSLQGGKKSNNPVECSEDYGGPNPMSEPETRNIINYWKANGPIVGAIDWHSYGQLILHPWGQLNGLG